MTQLTTLPFLTPIINLTYLESGFPLVKTISTAGVDPYPNVSKVTSHTDAITNIHEFFQSIQHHANNQHALLKGPLMRSLVSESRMGLTDKAAPTRWMCLDFDKFAGDLDATLNEIGLGNTSYIMQYSASQGFKPGLSAHLFFVLIEPITPVQLKQWLIMQNLTAANLKPYLTLNKTGTALKYPLDIVTADNSRLLYIAPPIFLLPLTDPIASRFAFIQRGTDVATLKGLDTITEPGVRKQQLAYVQALQPPGTTYNVQYSYDKTLDAVIGIPSSPSRVTGVKDDPNSDFIYVNLNGGDSWAYFVRRDDREYLHNFKGEPIYRTRDVAPELLPIAKIQCFMDYYDEGFVTLIGTKLHNHRNYRLMQSMCTMNNVAAPKVTELLPLKIEYKPGTKFGLGGSPTDITYNKYRQPSLNPRAGMFANIEKVVKHVCVDMETYGHFTNWLAYIIQTHRKSKTAWVFTGVPGTGKGLLVDTIIAGMVGKENLVTLQKEVLEGQFNPYVANNLFVVYDEAKFDLLSDKRIDHKLKILVTSDEIQMNDKNIRHRMVTSYSNLIITSNEYDVIHISNEDRRNHIAPRQEIPLRQVYPDIYELYDELVPELPYYYHFLKNFKVDQKQVTTIKHTEHREAFINMGKWGMDTVADIVKRGDYAQFTSLVIANVMQAPDLTVQTQYNELVELHRNEKVSTFSKGDVWVIARVCNSRTPTNTRQFLKQLSNVGVNFNEYGDIITTWVKPKEKKP